MLKFLGTTLTVALLLAGCGGGTNTLTAQTGGGGAANGTVASVAVSASPATIAADGSTTSKITAIALDANNVAVTNASVAWGTTAGLLQGAILKTDSTGSATATLSPGGAAAGTVIKVSATIGAATGSKVVNVVSTQQSLTLTTDKPQIASNASQSATISALVRDANNNALPLIAVTFQADSGVMTGTQPPPITDVNGIARATLNAGADQTDRTILVTATAGSAQPANIQVAVVGTTLSLSGPTALVLAKTGTYHVVLKDSAGAGIPSKAVTVTSANGNTAGIRKLL